MKHDSLKDLAAAVKTLAIDPEAAHPPLKEARAALVKVQLAAQAHEAEIARLQRLSAEGTPKKSRIDQDAERLVVGDTASSNESHRLKEISERLESAGERRQVFRRAVEIAKARVTAEEQVASHLICEKNRPIHFAIVVERTAAMILLGRQVELEILFREKLADAGVGADSHLPSMIAPGIGRPDDASSKLAWFFRDLCENGLIGLDAIPPDWRAKWGADFWPKPAAAA